MSTRKMSVKDVATVAGLAATVMGVCFTAWWYTARQTVWLLNGLPGPLVVRVDGAGRTVNPGDRVDVSVAVGVHTVRVTTLAGGFISEETVVVPARHDVVAYNVLGAMGIYAAGVVYVPRAPRNNHHRHQSSMADNGL